MSDIVERLRETPTDRTWDSVGRAYDYPARLPLEAADEIARLRTALADMTRKRDVLRAGLSDIVNFQSALTRSQVREAAQDILERVGAKVTGHQDKSPVVKRALAAEASLAKAREALEWYAKAQVVNQHPDFTGYCDDGRYARKTLAALSQPQEASDAG